ncbi:MAG: hypothetical protein PHO23_01825 [Candidatus Pacebacteria bacterium]|nr:hypothetical protein [Candidatus Paceibacterota bacterium]
MDPSEYETIDTSEGYNINSMQAQKLNIRVEGYYNVEETTTTTTKYTPPTFPPTTTQESNFPEQYNPFFNFNSLKDYLLTNILKIFK